MNKKMEAHRRPCRLLRAALPLAVGLCLAACSDYDLDEKNPAGWGESIYNYLAEDGHYQNTIRLINDLGQRETLAKTGSKTLFVADDEAYGRFFQSNKWGVKSYDALSTAQKKMLLMGAMVSSSYQVNDLSSLEGPIEGMAMRRLSSLTYFDTVSVVKTANLPNMTPETSRWNNTWLKFGDRPSVMLMKDMTPTPMLHFIEQQMVNNKITNDDYNFLYNYSTSRQPGDASVNGVKIVEQNIKCSNGFIHKMADVVLPLDNMAEVVASHPQVSIFSKLLDRFSTPYYIGKADVDFYNDQNGTSVDSIFQKRFFSSWSQNGSALSVDEEGRSHADELLPFDPGWNSYATNADALISSSLQVALQRNMGGMMVPSDEAMEEYWNNGPGQVLKDQYKTWDNVPTRVVRELVKNNMQSDFVNHCVPSKFASILNDANDPMGVTTADIDSVWLACNGAVFLTNRVFSPTSFVSVLYPAVVNENMSVINWAVEQCQYNVYLNSLNSYYSFFIPDNNSLLSYVDPVSYGKPETQLYRFHYDKQRRTVWASVWAYNNETRLVGDSIGEVRSSSQLVNRLRDVLDNHIVIGNVEDGNTYYKTKGGQEIRVRNASLGVKGMTVEGSYQINETKKPVRVTYIYDQTKEGNGKCYILDGEPVLTTRMSVIDVMRQHDEMSEMVKLLEGSGMMERIHDDRFACISENLSVFNTYNYTVYVPTNESIRQLQESGKLPTWDQVAQEEAQGRPLDKTRDSLAIENFLQTHIQDGSLFIGAKPQAEDGYETACIGGNGKFVKVYSTLTADGLSIRPSQTSQSYSHVVKQGGLYNLMAREYQLDQADPAAAGNIYTTSTAVIHLIDKPITTK